MGFRLELGRVFGFSALCWLALVLGACHQAPADEEPIRAVRTYVVGRTGQGHAVEFAAEVRARTQSVLSFRVGGKLIKRLVDLGQPVTRGELLAQIDPQDLQLGRQAAQAALAGAKANFEMAQADAQRFRALRAQGFISQAELDRHETALIAAKAQYDQARAQAGVETNQALYTSLLADANGVVTGVEAEPGQVVGPGSPVLVVARDGSRDAVFNVPEDRVDWVKSLIAKAGLVHVRQWGQQATSPATIREVAASADPYTRTFTAKADIGGAPLKLGQTATVILDAPGGAPSLRVPMTALFEHGGRSCVWRLDPSSMTVVRVPVQVADMNQDDVTVSAGLQPGDEIVDAGVHVLKDQQKVLRYHAVAEDAGASVPQ